MGNHYRFSAAPQSTASLPPPRGPSGPRGTIDPRPKRHSRRQLQAPLRTRCSATFSALCRPNQQPGLPRPHRELSDCAIFGIDSPQKIGPKICSFLAVTHGDQAARHSPIVLQVFRFASPCTAPSALAESRCFLPTSV
ncbi:Hypothetical predicted protein [Cloeon dipterum]|uniref:Uncharacterized protein n=1 Tax=Cloeon dipterum TaxID=197152 RepID=A0A8S1D7R1_9INSE|nr:Hypothetical predicted protein [Cloeon dipterum]